MINFDSISHDRAVFATFGMRREFRDEQHGGQMDAADYVPCGSTVRMEASTVPAFSFQSRSHRGFQ